MIDPSKLEEVVKGFTEGVKPGLESFQQDAEKNIRAAATAALRKLDLVTREEFDVQTQVLQRTREKLEQLEQRVAELEKAAVLPE